MTHLDVDAIRRYIRTELLNDETLEIGPDQDLLLSETLDSLNVVRLVAHLEAEAGIDIPAQDVTLENFATLQKIEAYLASRT